jgi:hypothetical protein
MMWSIGQRAGDQDYQHRVPQAVNDMFSTIYKQALDTEHVFPYNGITTLVLANMFAARCRLG